MCSYLAVTWPTQLRLNVSTQSSFPSELPSLLHQRITFRMQPSGCLVLQLGNDAVMSRNIESVLVDSACEVHLTDRILLEQSGRNIASSSLPNIMAAGDHTRQHIGKHSCILKSRMASLSRARARRVRLGRTSCPWISWWTRFYQVIISEMSRSVSPQGDSLPLTKIGGTCRLPVVL